MAKIAILYCKRIKDHSCIACAKCFRAIAQRDAEFARYEEVELVGMTDCGDCPGLIAPRVKLLKEVTRQLGSGIDTVYLGTCVKTAVETAQCPLDIDEVKLLLEKQFGVQVVVGTHSY